MASVNKVTIVGNLGRDPELRYMPSGDAIANIAVATSYKPKDKDAVTEWHRIVFFGRLAEIVGEYCKKGSAIYVEGRLQTRKYQKDGVDHYATEIVAESMQLLDKRQDDGGQQQRAPQRQPQGQSSQQDQGAYERQKGNGRPAQQRPAADHDDDGPPF